MPAAWPMPARWRSATRARCSSARGSPTRSMPSAARKGKREVKVIASGLYRPNGVAFKNGTLYIAELSQISKIEGIEDKLDNPGKPTVIFSDLPKDEAHGWKYLAIGPDNKLYFEVGQPCNNCIPAHKHGHIRRIHPD